MAVLLRSAVSHSHRTQQRAQRRPLLGSAQPCCATPRSQLHAICDLLHEAFPFPALPAASLSSLTFMASF